ncbi:hypothetical protein BGW38_005561 [Lunasporangiospora selenospora]|uniref:Uncharacterized protein n=1 Tax=Lunasporangiospora selenospora TaxID=979761 RepID=A0A9P6FN95_9FUNG|nr:hypothetical protein BGW38_005561 [Lunasporangiospora selenospora]
MAQNGCRDDPVVFLAKRYRAVLNHQVQVLAKTNPVAAQKADTIIPKVMAKIEGRFKVIDKTIFRTFKGTCVKPGQRPPSEFCGSAKSIACFAPWGHSNGLFDNVHSAVVEASRQSFKKQSEEIKTAMVNGLQAFCPQNCDDWIQPFQDIMLVWEQREHPHQYRTTPNCFELGQGGI